VVVTVKIQINRDQIQEPQLINVAEILTRDIIIIVALQPFVGPWPLFSFLILYTVGRTPWTGDQPVASPLPTHTKTQTE
jgi:hypothetical protein